MGAFIPALGQIGEAQAYAKIAQRMEEERQRKLAIEEAYNRIQQQYAATNQQRFGLQQSEFELAKQRELRLAEQANKPQYLGHIVAPDGSLIYGIQDPKGGIKFEKLPYSVDADAMLGNLSKGIALLPPEAQPAARAAVSGKVQLGDYKGAQTELDKYLLQYGKTQIPSQPTVSSTTGISNQWVDDPEHPGRKMLVQVPMSSTRVTQKVPPGGRIPGAGPRPAIAAPKPVASLTKTDAGTSGKIYAAFNKAQEAQTNLNIMRQDLAKAGSSPTGAGAFDMDLLSRHIAMTFGTVKGIRGGQYLIEHHIKARSLPEGLEVMYQRLKNGDQLSPEQRINFVHLAEQRVQEFQREYDNIRAEAGYQPSKPTDAPASIDTILDKVFGPKKP